MNLRSVPAAGVRVAVKTAVSQNGPADNESILDAGGDELLAEAALAARLARRAAGRRRRHHADPAGPWPAAAA